MTWHRSPDHQLASALVILAVCCGGVYGVVRLIAELCCR